MSELSGYVDVLGSTSVPPVDIGDRGSAFVSGRVFQTITGNRRGRRARLGSSGSVPGGIRAASAASASRLARSARASSGRSERCVQEVGDTNADCVFDVNDVRFVTQFLA